MDNKDKIFQKALAGFTFEVANRGAIRHLADQGFSIAEIRERLDFPASAAQIEEELQRYREEQASSGDTAYEYVRETDAYGRTSFRRVPRSSGS